VSGIEELLSPFPRKKTRRRKTPKAKRKGKERSYRCKIPVEIRFLHCGKKKADKSCLKKGIGEIDAQILLYP